MKPYLKDIRNDLKRSDTWKIQLAVATNLVPSKVADAKREMNSESDNIEIMVYEADKVVEELF